MKKIIITSVAVLVLAVPAALYFMGILSLGGDQGQAQAAEAAAVPKVPHYLALDPPFVVNFMHRGTLRYLQVSLEVMYHSEELVARVEQHMPAIRNDLILLFSGQEFEQLNSLEGKEALRLRIKEAINELIAVEPDAEDTGEVYITNFVMQ